MGITKRNEAHGEQLLVIASEQFGIHSFEPTGKPTTDIRLVRIADIERALERAYDFGLLMGHSVSRAEYAGARPSKLNCRAEQDWVRSSANDILGKYWR